MKFHELKPAPGSKHRRKIVGRGIGSGHGAQSTRGMKGQRSRAGVSGLGGFEGGQIPLIRRIPKRGFRHDAFRPRQAVINVGELNKRFDAKADVNVDALAESGLLKSAERIKILGEGDLSKALTVHAHAFSKSAREKIEKAGGRVEVLSH